MQILTLRDGRTGYTDIWNMRQLERHVLSEERPIEMHNHWPIFSGFKFYRKTIAEELKYEMLDDKIAEYQPTPYKLNPYSWKHKAIVAFCGGLQGIMICQYSREFFNEGGYHIRFVDVHKDYKRQGIASSLVSRMENSDFIKGHILYCTNPTQDGLGFLETSTLLDVKHRNYELVLPDYNR